MKNKKLFIAVLFIAIAILCAACSKDEPKADTTTPAPTEAGKVETPATGTPDSTPAGETTTPTETAAPTEEPAPTEAAAPTEEPAPTEKPAPTEEPAPTVEPDSDDSSLSEFTGCGPIAGLSDLEGQWDCTIADCGYIIKEDGRTYNWYSDGGVDWDTQYTIRFENDYTLELLNNEDEVLSVFTIQDHDNITASDSTVYQRFDEIDIDEAWGNGYGIEYIDDILGSWTATEADGGFRIEEDGSVYAEYWGADDNEIIGHASINNGNILITPVGGDAEDAEVYRVIDYDHIAETEYGTPYVRVANATDADFTTEKRYLEVEWGDINYGETPDLMFNLYDSNGIHIEEIIQDLDDGIKLAHFNIPDYYEKSTLEITGADIDTLNTVFSNIYLVVIAAESYEADPAFILQKDSLSDYYVRSETGVWYYKIPINWNTCEIGE